jgi:hypothetical protein
MERILKLFALILLILSILALAVSSIFPQIKDFNSLDELNYLIKTQVAFDANNIRSFIWNEGVFDQDLRTNNTPGLEWPKGAGKFVIFTAGFTIGAYVNGGLRLATASYSGEYGPGYCIDSVFHSDSRFKHYSVKPTDNYINNSDWLNWGLMVPFGAPYVDVNHNGTYEFVVDTPGVRGAAQTIFICLTDANDSTHSNSSGFGGGTRPLGAEVHLTAWAYNVQGLQDMQFFKWEVINKHVYSWDSAYFSIVSDPDLGDANDDYVGCDTLRKLVYCYNSDNLDGTGSGISYGANPPSVGFLLLRGAYTQQTHLSASSLRIWFKNLSVCEHEANAPIQAYNLLKGLKNDGTPIVIPYTNPPVITKYTFSGDPETMTGWTEYGGWMLNCGGSLQGEVYLPMYGGDRRYLVSSGAPNLSVNPNDTQTIIMAQLIARGTSNLNSVTKLKQLADVAIQLYNNGFVIGVEPISSEIPQQFVLYQNYPNPFNPITKIKFQIPLSRGVSARLRNGQEGRGVLTRIVIYDILGREVETLINESATGGLKPGTYEVEWNASNYPNGVYFYKLTTDSYSETKKMVLIK